MGEEDAVAAAINLQRDAGVMLSNLQILSQFATSLHRMSTEMLILGMGHVVFPSQEVASLSPAPRAPRAAQYMAAMGLWRPPLGLGDPWPVSSCNACMNFDTVSRILPGSDSLPACAAKTLWFGYKFRSPDFMKV